jgi:surface protein
MTKFSKRSQLLRRFFSKGAVFIVPKIIKKTLLTLILMVASGPLYAQSISIGSDNIVRCKGVSIGTKQTIDDIEYEVVDRARLIAIRNGGGDLTKVCVSNVTDMSELFQYRTFNQNIGNWDVSSVTDMSFMFEETDKFNQPIGNWDVSSVTNMRSMFDEAFNFNQPIGNWNVSSVTNMFYMFSYSPFNQDISNWNVSFVTNMNRMFEGSPFNQPINSWCVSQISSEPLNFSTKLSTNNKPIWGSCPFATSLAFVDQPQSAVFSASTGSITVEILDATGIIRMTNNTSSVTLSIANNAGSGTLSGTATVNAVSGLATFNDLSINKLGEGYTLSAESAGLFDNLSDGNAGSTGVTNTKWLAQAFSTTATDFVLDGVSLRLWDNSGTTTGNFEIQVWDAAGASGSPGAQVGSAIYTGLAENLPDASSLLTISGLSVTLGASTNYYLVAKGLDLIDGMYNGSLSWDLTNGITSNGYASTTSGSSWIGPRGNNFSMKVNGLTSATSSPFDITGAAANISINAGNNQSAQTGTNVPIAPSVLVTDANNNPVSGESVTFSVATGGGSITGETATTGVSGIATVTSWTMGSTAGSNTLTATSGSLAGSPLTFTATGYSTPQAPVITSLTAGYQQVTVAFTAPDDTGGIPITNYEYNLNNPNAWVPFSPVSTASPFTITGLTNDASYSIQLRAVNDVIMCQFTIFDIEFWDVLKECFCP